MKRKFLNPPKKRLLTLLCGCLFLFMIASCEEESSGKSQVPHDPNKPVELENIMPTSGKLREKVIIKGTNFGTDASIVKVSFVDSVNERKAVVIGLDNNTIYCMAPRQNPGANRIKIVVGDQGHHLY